MYRSITLFLLALLSLTAPAWASIIYVSGDQTGTWSADTVVVTTEVRVPPGQSLTILPGVEVLFSVYCKLIVDNGATLRAVGTPADSIRFDVLPPNVNWHGIRFLSASDSSRLEYCLLTNGYASGSGEDIKGGAIYCFNSSPTISGNTISGNAAGNMFHGGYGGGIACYVSSSPTIRGNIIRENSVGGFGGGIYCHNYSNPLIIGNIICGNSASSMYGDASGGGIYCLASSLTIAGNSISENTAKNTGGGICSSSNDIINDNIISRNSVLSIEDGHGGGISCVNNTIISGNIISENTSAFYGGGIDCRGGSPSVAGNTIRGNEAEFGGGIYTGVAQASPNIRGNIISENIAHLRGGGICCGSNSSPTIISNTLNENISNLNGGGIYCGGGSNPSINCNTISENSAYAGGGIYCSSFVNPSNTMLVNSILWENSPQEIYVETGSNLQATYSDIQGGYTGTGNINAYPAFVDTAQGDYRLQWGSPCIDSGDPNPFYNDPDSTRADMGAWYYDQSMPVRVLLTPYNAPIQIPPIGGSFQYAIQVTNIATTALSTTAWCNITLPNGNTYGPVLGPLTFMLGSGQTLSRVRTQTVPASAPAGLYHYNAFAVAAGDTSTDSFTFTKAGAGGADGLSGWSNTGELFLSETTQGEASLTPTQFALHPCSPNPFNPITAISYQLSANSHVTLKVYDTAGRLVATLVDGWREAGSHEVTFNGANLASGLYLARLTAGSYTATQKLVLLK
jgi:hypothetical protein